jgi:hypothetical protein
MHQLCVSHSSFLAEAWHPQFRKHRCAEAAQNGAAREITAGDQGGRQTVANIQRGCTGGAMPKNLFFTLVVVLSGVSAAIGDAVVLVTNRPSPSQYTAVWSQLGIAGTPVTGPFTLHAGPITINGTDSSPAVIEQEGNNFVGDFTPGDYVIETQINQGLLSLHFSKGVSQAGVQFQGSDMNFPNYAIVVARDINHNILASYVTSTANHGKADGSAPYIGIKDITGPNIYYLDYSYGFDTPWAVNEISASIDPPLPIQSNAQLGSCLPSSSVGVLVQPPNVTAYSPQGNWMSSTKGVHVIPIEPAGVGTSSNVAPQPSSVVNSCASNSVTGQTVCVGNNTDVYLITGSSLDTKLGSGATAPTGFSGGTCFNCGVVFDSVNNRAVIEEGLKGPPSGSGIQILYGPNTVLPFWSSPIGFNQQISENIQLDPIRSLILSPNEGNWYEIGSTASPFWFEYSQQLTPPAIRLELDAAAEDCTTGIALATVEGIGGVSPYLFISDLSQATAAGSTWTAPEQFVSFPEFNLFPAGTDGIAIAPGSQLGIVTSEFGDLHVGVIRLPSSSSGGIPIFVDYAFATMPDISSSPLIPFNVGADPHTVTAYLSPNDGRAYALVTSWNAYLSAPTHIAVIDLQRVLDAPRVLGSHFVDPSYDMTQAVRYLKD